MRVFVCVCVFKAYSYRRIVGRLISKVTLFKPSFFLFSYGTVLMFSFVVWFNIVSCLFFIRISVEYCRIVGRLISKVTLFKPSFFVSSYGTVLMFSFVVWFNMCGDRSLFLFTKFSFSETS